MKLLLFPALITAFSLTAAAQSTCTTSNAHPIDADVAFVAFWTDLAIDWLAIVAIVGKRSLPLALNKRDLQCSAIEECLSYKTVPFCYNKVTYIWHAADGTTGNAETGVYTLPDGRQGNMYHGPYPTLTSGEVGAAQTSMPASGAGTGVASAPVTVTVQASSSTGVHQTVTKTESGGATSTGSEVVATQGSVAVLKSEAPVVKRPGWMWDIALIGFGVIGFLL